MNTPKITRLLIPIVLVLLGIYNLSKPDLDKSMKTFWMFLTPFALFIGIVRAFLLYKQKK